MHLNRLKLTTLVNIPEVVDSLSDCEELFLKSPPQIPGILGNGTILNRKQKAVCDAVRHHAVRLQKVGGDGSSNEDYEGDTNYNGGRLFPSCHAYDEADIKSTFTLTHAGPRASRSNRGSWRKMEICVACVMKKYCSNNGCVVAGARPGSSSYIYRPSSTQHSAATAPPPGCSTSGSTCHVMHRARTHHVTTTFNQHLIRMNFFPTIKLLHI
uniref:DNA/RNA non-specific endonuclease domain-containing protein n=1 Tax=Takifugu rubripes TaxID=31033 RepID=A0A674NY99_TAKRU